MDEEPSRDATARTADAPALSGPRLGTVIDGRYRLIEAIGAGGVGVVYRARHLQLDRDVALKVLLSEHAQNDAQRRRFQREAKALAALSHPHIVTVTDFGFSDDTPYLAMELLAGETLKQALEAHGTLPLPMALMIADQMLEAVAYAHERELIHRDLKPRNVFLQTVSGRDAHVRVLDFGLAKFVNPERATIGNALTRTGMVFGTPAYMAPEQAIGSRTDARTDVYALGILLYELLTGERPFRGEPTEVMQQQMMSPLPRLTEARPALGRGPELERLLDVATAKRPDARYPNAGAMLGEFRALTGDVAGARASSGRGATVDDAWAQPPASSPKAPRFATRATTLALGAALVLLAVAGAAWLARGGEAPSPVEAAATHPQPVAARAPSKATRPVGEASAERASVADPWAGGVPEALQAIAQRIETGRDLTPRMEKQLRAHARTQHDPRALLLLARAYVQRGWRSDGIEKYEEAFERDSAMKGDPHMREDLIRLVGDRAVSSLAHRAVVAIYGRDALATLEPLLSEAGSDTDVRARYLALRDALQELPPTADGSASLGARR